MNQLVNFRETPPRGWLFFQPEINWRPPDPMLPLDMVAQQLSIARFQNPAAGLDPSLDACIRAIGLYTCKRAEGKDWFKRFCTSSEIIAEQAMENARPRKKGGCGGGCK